MFFRGRRPLACHAGAEESSRSETKSGQKEADESHSAEELQLRGPARYETRGHSALTTLGKTSLPLAWRATSAEPGTFSYKSTSALSTLLSICVLDSLEELEQPATRGHQGQR